MGQVLSAKLLALISIIVLTLLPSLLFVQTVAVLGFPKSNFDSSLILGGYLALFLLILCFVGFGVLASSLSRKQPVVFILGLVLNFVFWQGAKEVGLEALDLSSHYNRLSMGLLSFSDLIFFLGFFLLLWGSIRFRLRQII
jgi:ABC-2 type transport system permease protein